LELTSALADEMTVNAGLKQTITLLREDLERIRGIIIRTNTP
jgi:hypothetical protein